jgi:hypothetical protein
MKSSTICAASLVLAALVPLTSGCGAPSLHLRSSFVYNAILSVHTPPVTNLNPITGRSAADQLYDEMVFQTLLGLNPAGRPQPQLALSWRHNTRSTLWQIALNPSAKWWTGRPITANDVVWTLDLYRNSVSGFVRSQELKNVVRIDAQSPTLVQIWLSQPDRDFARDVLSTHGGLWILPSFLLDHLPPDKVQQSDYLTRLKDVVGSGPFRPFRRSSRGLTWVADPHYFLGAPHIKYMRWVWSPGLSTLARDNDLDLAWTSRPDQAFGSHYQTARAASPTLWGLKDTDIPLSVLKSALRLSKLPGPSVLVPESRTQLSLKQTFAHLGYRRQGSHWVTRHGPVFSVSLSGPQSGFGHTLLKNLAEQWTAHGIIVHLLPSQKAVQANLIVQSTVAPPFSSTSTASAHWWPLLRTVDYWHVNHRLTDWRPNAWEPLYNVEDWRLKSRRNS